MSVYDHDLRTAAIHEAAHIVAARSFGLLAFAHLSETGTADTVTMKMVNGQCQLCGHPASVSDRRVIGLAGRVAEYNLELGFDAFDPSELSEWLDLIPDDLSTTDAELADAFDEKDVERCIALLADRWPEIESEAKCLMNGVRPA